MTMVLVFVLCFLRVLPCGSLFSCVVCFLFVVSEWRETCLIVFVFM